MLRCIVRAQVGGRDSDEGVGRVRQAFAFMVALFIIFVYAFFAIFFIKSLQTSHSSLDDQAREALQQLLENPGNFTPCLMNNEPPVVGIAINGSAYVINKSQLLLCITCSRNNYTAFKLGIVPPEDDVLITIYNPSDGTLLRIGSGLIRGNSASAKAYALFPNGTRVVVTLTVSGG